MRIGGSHWIRFRGMIMNFWVCWCNALPSQAFFKYVSMTFKYWNFVKGGLTCSVQIIETSYRYSLGMPSRVRVNHTWNVHNDQEKLGTNRLLTVTNRLRRALPGSTNPEVRVCHITTFFEFWARTFFPCRNIIKTSQKNFWLIWRLSDPPTEGSPFI